MTPMKWFYSFYKKYQWKMILGLSLTTVLSALAIINPYLSGIIVDQVIEGGKHSLLMPLVACLIAVTAARGALRVGSQFIFEKCSQGILYTMRDKVYKNLLLKDFAFYNKSRTGDLMSRQTGDMDAIRHFVAYVIYNVYEYLLMFIIALVMIFTVNVKLAWLMVLVLPFSALTMYLQSRRVRPAFAKIRQQFSSLNAFVQENISGNRVVKAFAKEDFEQEKFDKENMAYRNAELGAADVWKKYVPVFEFLSALLTVILMAAGGYMVIMGEITLGNLVTVNGYLWMLTVPLRAACWLVNDALRFVTSVDKIYATVSEEPQIKKPEKAVVRKHMEGVVEFRNVSYKAEDEDIVSDINFTIKRGQTVGIIGSTGAGKSTIMNLLCRFYDTTQGDVLIDGINVKDIDLYDLRDNIGMAMQDVFLFSDTIEGNIAYGKPDCSFEKVKWAATAANADDFIQKMPEGYDTIVGERGVGLSGGQKQRISLARALLKEPAILILDDTTSAVDMETETYIQQSLKSLGSSHTIFVIAYRISSIKDADVILVMDNGKIVETGNHQSLLKQNGYYSTIFRHQYGDVNQFRAEGGIAYGTK